MNILAAIPQSDNELISKHSDDLTQQKEEHKDQSCINHPTTPTKAIVSRGKFCFSYFTLRTMPKFCSNSHQEKIILYADFEQVNSKSAYKMIFLEAKLEANFG